MSNRLIYLVDGSAARREDLASQIGHYGYGISSFDTLAQATAEAKRSLPAVILISLTDLEGDMALEIGEIQSELNPPPPIIFIADSGDPGLRLRSVRFGARGFFPRPVNIDALIGILDTLTTEREIQKHRVLIVESDSTLASEFETILRNAGILTCVISNPLTIYSAVADFSPELILMDLYYPEILGMELAAVMRQQHEFQSIPIVFHSNDTDQGRQTVALQKGGDDYLTRPIHPEYLVLFVLSRVDRARSLHSLMRRDSLTGLLTHTGIHEALEQRIKSASVEGKEVPFVIVDIDKFKRINDTYGHPIGDIVLKSLARLLKQRVWSADVVGRLGGEEFGIIINSMDAMTASRIFNEIRVDFAQIRHTSDAGDFYATFSCGIASYPRYGDLIEMENAAERAVRHAKNLGGNKVALIR
ncbi:MAG: diguanylate cyclase [Spirochaetia bacterium]|nr:diguanylate cyclase [Spirochaetia bacterium]